MQFSYGILCATSFRPARQSQSMPSKAYGSVLFSVTKTASEPYLVTGFCQKIDRFVVIDWLQRNQRLKDLWDGMLVCYTSSKDLHNGMYGGTPVTNGGRAT